MPVGALTTTLPKNRAPFLNSMLIIGVGVGVGTGVGAGVGVVGATTVGYGVDGMYVGVGVDTARGT